MEYRDQMIPVAASAVDCEALNFSAGLAKSPIPAITNAHLNDGAQKKIVLGPAGCSHSGRSFPGTTLSPAATRAR